jgi:hypothetical protein
VSEDGQWGNVGIEVRIRDLSRLPDTDSSIVRRDRLLAMGLCANCEQRPWKVIWGDAITANHGGDQRWCETCVRETRLEHADEHNSSATPSAED